MIIGVNGCGKFIFLKVFICIYKIKDGIIIIDGYDIVYLFIKEIVKKIVFFLQVLEVIEGIIVYELIFYGWFLY